MCRYLHSHLGKTTRKSGWVSLLSRVSAHNAHPLCGPLLVHITSNQICINPLLIILLPISFAHPHQYDHLCARNYRPSFRENKPKTLVFNDPSVLGLFSLEIRVYKFGHWCPCRMFTSGAHLLHNYCDPLVFPCLVPTSVIYFWCPLLVSTYVAHDWCLLPAVPLLPITGPTSGVQMRWKISDLASLFTTSDLAPIRPSHTLSPVYVAHLTNLFTFWSPPLSQSLMPNGQSVTVPRRLFFAALQRIAITWSPK